MFAELVRDLKNMTIGGDPVILTFPGRDGPNSSMLRAKRIGETAYFVELVSADLKKSGIVSFPCVVRCFEIAWTV